MAASINYRITDCIARKDVSGLQRLLAEPAVAHDFRAQAEIAGAFGILKARSAVAVLEDMSTSEDVDVRRAAMHTLSDIGEPTSLSCFERGIGDSDHAVRMWAVYGLRELSTPAAERALVRVLESPHASVRRAAARYVQIDEESKAKLQALRRDPDLVVRWIAWRRLRGE